MESLKEQKYTIKSHPTIFNGVQYRSRLEARWAAFFTLEEMAFEYEPLDLEGWSPDFLLLDANAFVEVKPLPADTKNIPDDVRKKIEAVLHKSKRCRLAEILEYIRIAGGNEHTGIRGNPAHCPEYIMKDLMWNLLNNIPTELRDDYRSDFNDVYEESVDCTAVVVGMSPFRPSRFAFTELCHLGYRLNDEGYWTPWMLGLSTSQIFHWKKAGNLVQWKPQS